MTTITIHTTADHLEDIFFLITDLGFQGMRTETDGADGVRCILDGTTRGETSSFWMERLEADLEMTDIEFELTRQVA